KPRKAQRDELLAAVRKRLHDERLAKLTAAEKALLAIPKDQRTNDLKARIEGLEKKVDPSEKEIKVALSASEKSRQDTLDQEIDALMKRRREFTFGLLARDNSETVPVTKVLFQGDHRAGRE